MIILGRSRILYVADGDSVNPLCAEMFWGNIKKYSSICNHIKKFIVNYRT